MLCYIKYCKKYHLQVSYIELGRISHILSRETCDIKLVSSLLLQDFVCKS